MSNESKDLWDYQDQYNESPNAENSLSKVVITKKAEKELKKALNKIIYAQKSVVNIDLLLMAEKYKKAWKTVYDSQKEWRKKEIDNQMKSGKLSDKSWDNDFVRQVASLAESDDPLEA